MRSQTPRDFASLLDELIAESVAKDHQAGRPTIPFDYLAVADELHSGRISVAPDVVEAEYRHAEIAIDALFGAASAAIVEEVLPSIEPDAISKELDLSKLAGADLARKRRAFAFKNHPDRVAPHLRQRAMVRMQIANMLIDEAESRSRRPGR